MSNSPPTDLKSKYQAKNCSIALLTIVNAHDYDGVLGTEIPIYLETGIWVGRDESKCSLVFRSNIVSGVHFHIYSVIYDEDSVAEFPPLIYCEDHCSTNGTYVNGTLIGKLMSPRSPYLLSDGDAISIRPYWKFLFTQKCQGVERDRDDIQTQELELIRDRYDVSCKLLGSGVYGSVFLASDMATRMQLACKIVDLRRDALEPKQCITAVYEGRKPKVQAYAEKATRVVEIRKKLMREIEILSKLSHPNVVTLHKAFRSPHSLYIFSELAAGGDLFSFLQNNGYCLDDLHARVISRQVAIAVEYLHSQGIAHRDLKPENILVMRRGIGHRVVLTDFGCAGYTRTPTGRMMSTVGTFDYVAPEVYKTKKKGYTEAIDMWSLGVVTLCLLTGDALITFDTLPQMSQSDIAMLLTNANDKHLKWRDLNMYGQDFVKKLLVLDPEKRMTSRSAIEHDWFTKPARIAAELDKLYERAITFWPKRRHGIGIVEDLPNLAWAEGLVSRNHKNDIRLPPQTCRKIPDATASRYFGLDRHLRSPGAPSKSMLQLNRKRVLEALKEADMSFIDTISQSGGTSTAPTENAKLSLSRRENSPSMAALKETRGLTATTSFSNGPITSRSRKRRVGQEEEVYIKSEDSSSFPGANKARRLTFRRHGRLVTEEVNGNDLFGTPIEIKAAQAAEAASDEMSPYEPLLDETFLGKHFEGENIPSYDEPKLGSCQFLEDNVLVDNTVPETDMPTPSSFRDEEIADNVRKRTKRPLS